MYDTLREISHALDGYYIWIFVVLMYIACLWTIIETVLLCWKDKMTIDYIFEWHERRKNGKNKRNT